MGRKREKHKDQSRLWSEMGREEKTVPYLPRSFASERSQVEF